MSKIKKEHIRRGSLFRPVEFDESSWADLLLCSVRSSTVGPKEWTLQYDNGKAFKFNTTKDVRDYLEQADFRYIGSCGRFMTRGEQ